MGVKLGLSRSHRLRGFKNRVLRRIFGPKRKEDGSWRKLHNEELHSLYSSPNIFRVTKSRGDEVGGTCGTHGGRERCLQGFWLGGPRIRDHWEDLGVSGRITLS
jgi:hypothetical protein